MNVSFETLPLHPGSGDIDHLCALLRDAVEGGASVGFMLPVRDVEMREYWQDVFADGRNGSRLILAARDSAGCIVGSVQLALAAKPNSRHRAELQKLLVLRRHRRRGLGRGLIDAAETSARSRGRTLIVLDTSSTGDAIGMYERCGYIRAGMIPRYARDPDGPLIDTVIYYKELKGADRPTMARELEPRSTNGES